MAYIRVNKADGPKNASLSLTSIGNGNVLSMYGSDCEQLNASSVTGTQTVSPLTVGNFNMSASLSGSTWTISVKSLDGRSYTLKDTSGTTIGTFTGTAVSFTVTNGTKYCFAIEN